MLLCMRITAGEHWGAVAGKQPRRYESVACGCSPYRRTPMDGRAGPEQPSRVFAAVLSLNAGLDLTEVLDRIIEAAVDLVGARYGALGVLSPDRDLTSRAGALGRSFDVGDRASGGTRAHWQVPLRGSSSALAVTTVCDP